MGVRISDLNEAEQVNKDIIVPIVQNDGTKKTKLSTLINVIYPIGSIYMSVNDTNPSELFGGTWELWGSGRVPVGVDVDDTDFNEVEKTGGEKAHTLTLDEMPRHNHKVNENNDGPGLYPNWGSESGWGATAENINGNGGQSNTAYAGNGSAHNNMPPYITCFMWKRVE